MRNDPQAPLHEEAARLLKWTERAWEIFEPCDEPDCEQKHHNGCLNQRIRAVVRDLLAENVALRQELEIQREKNAEWHKQHAAALQLHLEAEHELDKRTNEREVAAKRYRLERDALAALREGVQRVADEMRSHAEDARVRGYPEASDEAHVCANMLDLLLRGAGAGQTE